MTELLAGYDSGLIVIMTLTFLLAGTVKGITGLGLPTVSLALLTVAIDLTSAMALLLIPSLVTNLWQAAVGGHGTAILKRLWPFLLPATLLVWPGSLALQHLDLKLLSALLGVLLASYALINLSGLKPSLPLRHQTWGGAVIGAINGILTGMTGSFVIPGVIYLQAIGLPRDALIQAMGILFSLSTLALALALQSNDLLSPQQAGISALAVIPALLGMVVGQAIRQRLSETWFKRVFFCALLLLGGYIISHALLR
ncbi:MAG: sulfite exporter TauE/SafE family protein [Motiliproteus sp.]